MPTVGLNSPDNASNAMAVPCDVIDGEPILPRKAVIKVSGVTPVSGYSNVYQATEVKRLGQFQPTKWANDGLDFALTGKEISVRPASVPDTIIGTASIYYEFKYISYKQTPELEDLSGGFILKDGNLYRKHHNASWFMLLDKTCPDCSEPMGYILEMWNSDKLNNFNVNYHEIKVRDDKGVAYMLRGEHGWGNMPKFIPYDYGVIAFTEDGGVKKMAEATILLHDGKFYNFLGFTGDVSHNAPEDMSDKNGVVSKKMREYEHNGKWYLYPYHKPRVRW